MILPTDELREQFPANGRAYRNSPDRKSMKARSAEGTCLRLG